MFLWKIRKKRKRGTHKRGSLSHQTVLAIIGSAGLSCFPTKFSSPNSSPVFPTVRGPAGPSGGTAKSPGRDGTAICSPSGVA